MARTVARQRSNAVAPPEWVAQRPQLVDAPPDGDQWLHEIKFDGALLDSLDNGNHSGASNHDAKRRHTREQSLAT